MKKITYLVMGVLLLFFIIPLTSAFNFETGGVKIIEPLEDGSLKVILQEQHTEIIDLILHQEIDTFELNQSYAIENRIIEFETTGGVPTTEMIICLKEGVAFYQADIISVTAVGGNIYRITLDSPLDFAFTTLAYGCISSTNMAIDGSITPQTFHITPQFLNDGVQWDINRVIFVMSGEGVGVSNDYPDDSDFGVTSNLYNGIVLRSVNGITKNIFNIKRNGEFRLRAYDVTYTEKSKAGLYSVGVRRTFNGQEKNGVVVRLDANTNDTIEVIIQDDLTEMFGMKAVVQGNVVRN